MSDWSKGYNKSGYTFGYYSELSPVRIKFAFINAGCVFPTVGRSCELGFGQGVSINIHASATITEWHGTDFNSSQVSYAKDLASRSGNGVSLSDDSFEGYLHNCDFGDKFDFICLHGIWSWIAEADRRSLLRFIELKLAVGGVLYISYNTSPGWSSFLPIRNLMMDHINGGSKAAEMDTKIDEAIAFAERLKKTSPGALISDPIVTPLLKRMHDQERRYLAHEFFNQNWNPVAFSDVARDLTSIKLDFACSATYLDHIDVANLTADQQSLVNMTPDWVMRQSIRDHMINQVFRKDYWVRGKRVLTQQQRLTELNKIRIIFTSTRQSLTKKFQAPLGEVKLEAEVYDMILGIMDDYKIISFGELLKQLQPAGFELASVFQAVMLLIHVGGIHVAQEASAIDQSESIAKALNKAIIADTINGDYVGFLASPVTGGGHAVSRTEQWFINENLSDHDSVERVVAKVWSSLKAQNQKLVAEGKKIESEEANINQLKTLATQFLGSRRKLIIALKIA